MVIFDPTLDTFPFAHLSVREFLEKQQEFARATTNALAAERCLLDVLKAADGPGTRRFLSNYAQASSNSALSYDLRHYSKVYWAPHCHLASAQRTSGVLRDLLRQFLCNDSDPRSAVVIWASRIQRSIDHSIKRELIEIFQDIQTKEDITLFIASCFNLQEFARIQKNFGSSVLNSWGRTALHVATRHGSCEVMSILLQEKNIVITEEVVKAAAGNWRSGEEVIMLLLEERGVDAIITEEVVKAAAGNYRNGKEVMMLLLEQRDADVVVTEEVVKAIVRNFDQQVMMLLPEQRGADVVVTEETGQRSLVT